MVGKRSALSRQKFEKASQAFPRQRRYEKQVVPFSPETITRVKNDAIYYTKLFNDLTSGEVNISKLLHANIGFLKTFTKSLYGYVYLVNKNQLYFSTPTTNEKENDHWTIEQDSPRIAAAVAYKKEFVVIKDVRKQKRFLLGCHIADTYNIPKSLLCVPLVTPSDVCFGVIELQRHATEEPYGMSDIKTIVAITGWMGATVHQSWERMQYERDLELADSYAYFLYKYLEGDSDVDTLITDITNIIKDRLGAEKCVFYKTDQKEDELVAYSFEESLASGNCKFVDQMYMKNTPVRSEDEQGLLSLALKTREIMNIEDVYDPRFNPYKDGRHGGVNFRNALVLPIWNSSRPLAVLMIINKVGCLRFKSDDEDLLKKMCPYMAAALEHNYYREHNNTREIEIDYYRDLVRQVMMPCRHYKKLKQAQDDSTVAEVFPQMTDPVWYLKSTDEEMKDHLLLNMMIDVINETDINMAGLQRMIRWAHTGYRDVQYHNFEHAFNVTHCVYSVIKRNPDRFKPIEKKGLIIAALFHDIDHPGYNNNFLHLTRHSLAKLYPESTLECHHYSNRSDLCRILHANEFQWDNVSHRILVKSVVMTYADLSGLLKDFEVVQTLTNRLYSEFYNQGDIEAALGYPPISMMDRKRRYIVPKDQYHFMNVIVIPCVELLTTLIPNTQVSLDKGIEISNRWFDIIQKGQKYWASIDNFEEVEKESIRISFT
ncbi:cAMP and cAMP-inhibited cGMP 3',5'-cyclic phosphodiesterase 10A-like isoform X2 [Agrilus planipennis]|uniref:Phosphodiesterase n=1 Tax=Agrilus planipennis TaxID=224129 RepID=A0A1W4X9B6_AGRPL|nr:cAMP and cAMP-inhibited cGMP 3',5'-cyclic phosphodiesterase 10A-like isoform X2 [Agrilus planipennis]